MVTKTEVIKSLKKQGLVSDPESWMKLAALIACVSTKRKEGEPLDEAVYKCYQEINKEE